MRAKLVKQIGGIKLPSSVDEVMQIIRTELPVVQAEPPSPPPQKRLSVDDKIKEQELVKQMMPMVYVEDDGTIDTLRDTKWVYQNIGKLFRRDDLGLEQLDEDVLAEAPSNGAVGLAHYCFNDRKAFFEKFVIKILDPKKQEEEEQTEEELAAELDPSFDGLEKYLEKVENGEPD